ncbi:hypothetical protein PCK1_000034 [Pneumocystis canis]|nr:hypothetical protein PCK1_000034 [Pneumocystis canis]
MYTKSGIPITNEFYNDFRIFSENNDIFAIKIEIFQESLMKKDCISESDNFDKNLESIRSILSDIEPAYILCKIQYLPSIKILMISYIPENAKIRDKMIYASTRHTLLQSLGSDKILKSIFISNKEEINTFLFEEHLKIQKNQELLSNKEKNLQDEQNSQERAIGCSRKKYVNSQFFLGISKEAEISIKKLAENTQEFNFIQLVKTSQFLLKYIYPIKAGDFSTEILNLEMTTLVEPDNIQDVISSASPRYSIYSWEHTYNDSKVISKIFIYTCPKTSTIKERTFYSSAYSLALSTIQQWIHIDKKIETDDLININATTLYSILHPSIEKKEKLFLRPKRPGK